MCRKLFFLVSFVLVLGLVSNALGGDVEWDNGGGDRLWTNPANWRPDGVPVGGIDRLNLRFDPNIGSPNGPLITAGMDVEIGNVLDALHAEEDSYTEFNQVDPCYAAQYPEPNVHFLEMTGGKLTCWGLIRWPARGQAIWEMSGGTLVIKGGGKWQFGNYPARDDHCQSTGWWIMNGGTVDYTEGNAKVPNDYGVGHIFLNAGVIMTDSIDMADQEDSKYMPDAKGTIDVNGGTWILTGDERGHVGNLVDSNYILPFGYVHGTVVGGQKAVILLDYDVTNPGKTTMVAAWVDPNKASLPDPRDVGTTTIDSNDKVLLSWAPGPSALVQDIYYGSTFADVNEGTGGTYRTTVGPDVTAYYIPDTLALGDTRYWRIDGRGADPAATLLDDGFEAGLGNWTATGGWATSTGFTEQGVPYIPHGDANMAVVEGGAATCTLTSGDLNASGATTLYVDFWFMKDDTETGDFELYYYDGTSYDLIADLNDIGTEDGWAHYHDEITDSQYLKTNFRIQFSANPANNENVFVDDVVVYTGEAVWTGDTWTFKAADYLVVDNFQSYADSTALNVTWTSTAPDPGSEIYLDTTSGKAMEIKYYYIFSYDDAGRTPDSNDWTRKGVKSLSLEVRGDPNNSAVEMYVKVNGVEVTYPGNPNDFKLAEWQEFNVDLADFTNVDMNHVTNINIGFRGGSDTGVLGYTYILIDNIRLYIPRCVGEHKSVADIVGTKDQGGDSDGCVVDLEDLDVLTEDWGIGDYNIVTSAPGATGLVAYYDFEGDLQDSGPYALHGTGYGDATTVFNAERNSNVLQLDGNGDYVDCGTDPNFDLTSAATVAAWIKVDAFSRDKQAFVTKGDDTWRIYRHKDTMRFGHNDLTSDGILGEANLNDGKWHHVAGVYDGSKSYIYVDGALDVSIDVTGNIATDTNEVYIGYNVEVETSWFDGLIDEVRIYARALPQAEIAYLADDMAKPDDTANDGYKYVPVLSDAELYSGEARDYRFVNFMDFAVMAADNWLQAQTWP